jgi:general secretion pathway protein B
MSYILDALKKSEQQRQEIEPNTVSDRLLVNTAEEKTKTRKWWLSIVAVNLLIVAGLFGYLLHDKARPSGEPKLPVSRKAAIAQPSPPIPIPSNNPPPSETVVPVEAEPPMQTEAPSIADMMATEPVPVPVPAVEKANLHKIKPVQEKKPAAVMKKRNPEPSGQNSPQAEYQLEPGWRRVQESEPVENPPPVYEPVRPQIETRDSSDSGQTRPKLAINVFGYAQNPEERFVIINMQKYKVGERIKDGLELKAIHADHIELQQGGVSFKMKRP